MWHFNFYQDQMLKRKLKKYFGFGFIFVVTTTLLLSACSTATKSNIDPSFKPSTDPSSQNDDPVSNGSNRSSENSNNGSNDSQDQSPPSSLNDQLESDNNNDPTSKEFRLKNK
ncbi:hypothetical protein MCAV_07900 [[Mycoplasma] cavipharyngis]